MEDTGYKRDRLRRVRGSLPDELQGIAKKPSGIITSEEQAAFIIRHAKRGRTESMVQINHTERIINAKVVYYGPPLGGKTTSLKTIHRLTDPDDRKPLISMNTAQDRTLFFDLLPFTISNVAGYTLQLKLYTVPGQVQYNTTRRVVLSGADAVVMVVDSRKIKQKENRISLENLKENLRANGLSYKSIPLVIQYNKWDLDGLDELDHLQQTLNDRNCPSHTTVALTGIGIMESFVQIMKGLLDSFNTKFGSLGKSFDPVKLSEDIDRKFTSFYVNPSTATAPPTEDEGEKTGQSPAAVKGPAEDQSSLRISSDLYWVDDDESEQKVTTRAALKRQSLRLEEQLRESVRSNLELSEEYQKLIDTRNQYKQRVNELVVLSEIGRVVNSSLDLESMLSRVLEQAVTNIEGGSGSLLMLSDGSDQLDEKCLFGLETDPLNAIFIPGSGSVAYQLAQRREPIIYANLRDELFFGERYASCDNIHSMISVPLLSESVHRGIITVYSNSPSIIFDRHQLRFLSSLASQVTVGIENAYLYEELKNERSSLQQKVDERTRELNEAFSKLKEADAVKDRFLSSVSHEMKTPLTSIVSYAELLLSFREEPPETHEEFLRIIKDEAEKLHQMTSRVLYFTELEANQKMLELQPLDVDKVVITAAKELKAKLRAKDQKLSIRIRKPIRQVSGDRKRLFTVFYNLIENASKFSPCNSAVQVEADTIRDTSPDNPDLGPGSLNDLHLPVVRVSIRDQGPGINPDDQDRIFETFEQGGEILTSKPNGIGLGLPIARQIVQDHGGKILVRSQPDQGSEFIVLLEATA